MIRWALLSNTTISPLVRRLRSEMQAARIGCEFFQAEYGEALGQVFSENSKLLAFRPNLIVVHLDLEHMHPNLELSFAFETTTRQREIMQEVVGLMVSVAEALRARTGATLLVSNLPTLPRSVLGVGLDYIVRNAIRRANLDLDFQLREIAQCHVVDCDSLWAEAGWSERDRRFEAIAQMPMGTKLQKLLVEEWLRYCRALQGAARKCIVLDLDNTLWKGIVGEDGHDGIQMGDTPEGRGFRKFQQALKALTRRGVILALNSKNTMEDALEVIRNHPDMVLREQDFAAMQVNWDDKATNLSRIAADLNLKLEHMVFLDDNPVECAWVRQQHPEVLVLDLPQDSTAFCDVLTRCQLDTLAVTEEDTRRTQMYWEDRQRRAFQSSVQSYEQFLLGLDIQIDIQKLQPQVLERAVQLCLRTNQFNLTTKRHTAEDIKRFSESPNSIVLMMSLRDRFGEYGWCGLAIATAESEQLNIDSFLLSCRVMGKQAEFGLLSALLEWGASRGCTGVQGSFVSTGKNKACADFYKQCGMTQRESATPDSEMWFAASIRELAPLPITHMKRSVNFEKGLLFLDERGRLEINHRVSP